MSSESALNSTGFPGSSSKPQAKVIWGEHHFHKYPMAQRSLVLLARAANTTLPQWLISNISADEIQSCSRLDALCILSAGMRNGHQRDIQAIHPSRWDVHLIEVKYCDDTQPEQQLARATVQHSRLKHALAQQCHKVIYVPS